MTNSGNAGSATPDIPPNNSSFIGPLLPDGRTTAQSEPELFIAPSFPHAPNKDTGADTFPVGTSIGHTVERPSESTRQKVGKSLGRRMVSAFVDAGPIGVLQDMRRDSRDGYSTTQSMALATPFIKNVPSVQSNIAERRAAEAQEWLTEHGKTTRMRERAAKEMERRREDAITQYRAALEATSDTEGRARREGIRGRDLELKEREQEIRARELEQRERMLELRDEALARGEIIDIPSSNEKGRQATNKEDAAMQEYLKRKARWDEQTATIDSFVNQAEFAHLFDEEKLRELDAGIQAEVAPKYDAALQARISELNKTLSDDKKWKPVGDMTQQEKEVATRKLLSGKERGDIANPIDNDHTRQYLGDKANNRDLMLAISWQRRRLTGRVHAPQPPKKS